MLFIFGHPSFFVYAYGYLSCFRLSLVDREFVYRASVITALFADVRSLVRLTLVPETSFYYKLGNIT